MTATARRKGNRWEAEVVDVFRAAGFRQAQRTLAGAADDRGDIAGIPGAIVQCKNTNRLELGDFLTAAEKQAVTAGVDLPILAMKRRMKPAAEGYGVVPLGKLAELVAGHRAAKEAGLL